MRQIHPELLPKIVERLSALADENRIRILLRLRDSDANVSILTEHLGIAQASVSKHLSILRQAGLVDVERRGNQAVYKIRDASVFDMCKIVCDGVIRFVQQEHAAVLGPPRRRSTAVSRS